MTIESMVGGCVEAGATPKLARNFTQVNWSSGPLSSSEKSGSSERT